MVKKAKQATAALDVAEKAGIEFAVHRYEHDPAYQSFGLEAAEKMGVEPGRVFKTLLVDASGELAVAIVPVHLQLDLKACASALNVKAASMADIARAERTTGYVVGAISPLGQKKRLRTVLDASASTHDTICVSAGRRGLEIELLPSDLAKLTDATVAEIAR